MTTVVPAAKPARRTTDEVRLSRRLLRWFFQWPTLLLSFYLLAGGFFTSHGVFIGDAVSRVQIAQGVIWGYEPKGYSFLGLNLHAAAVGFVWGPLISMLEAPLLALDHIFPFLATDAYAGVIVSACFMTFGLWQLQQLLSEQGMSRAWQIVLIAGLALNPFIIVYASNGMSEAPYIALLLAATRHYVRWQRTALTSALSLSGIYLGLDWLNRYEMIGAAVAVTLMTAMFAYAREQGRRRARIRRGVVDVLIFLIPIAFFIAVFAGVSWWITGNAFQHLGSKYVGGSSLSGGDILQGGTTASISHQMFLMAPTLILLLAVAPVIHYATRETILPAVLAMVGAPLLVDVIEVTHGTVPDFERYMILVIPMSILLLTALRDWGRLGLILAVVSVVITAGGGWALASSASDGSQEYPFRQALLGRSDLGTGNTYMSQFREVAEWLDGQHIGNGRVLLDVQALFEVVLESSRPEMFVTNVFQNFADYIYDPYGKGIRYVVATAPNVDGPGDLINLYYPGLYEGCIDGTELMMTANGGTGTTPVRVYRLVTSITPTTIHYDGPCSVTGSELAADP